MLLDMPEKTKDGPKARHDLIHLGIREDIQAIRCDSEETEDKGKKDKKESYYCPPRLLHSKSEGDRSIYQVPSKNQSAFRLLGEGKQMDRPEETKVQRDEVS